MHNSQDGMPCELFADDTLHQCVGVCVYIRGRFVEYKDGGGVFTQESAGKAEELLLAVRERDVRYGGGEGSSAAVV